jgi:hypothetical protein
MTVHVPEFPFSRDPLMAEAKHRMRRRRVLAGAVALVLAAAAVGVGIELASRAGPVGAASPTNLTLQVTNGYGYRAVFHLTCHPPSGNLPRPAKACAAIAAQPSLITRPRPFMCWGTVFDLGIAGRMNSRSIHTKVSTCWTPQVALIRKLGLSLPRG